MTPDQIFALVAALIAGEPETSNFPNLTDGSADSSYALEIAPCARPVAPAEIEGETVICGTLEVPEDHEVPGGRKMNLSWIVYKSHSLAPAPDPVIYLHGGPGGGAVRSVAAVSGFFDHLRQRRDLITFDQRGVDASAPDMDCFNTVADSLGDAVDSLGGKEVPELQLEFVRGCVEEIQSRGIDITKMNTTQNALDVGALMSALGYPEYNIYGVSYGTKLTLEALRQKVPNIRAVILDGVAPPQVHLYDQLITPHTLAIENTFAPCEADPTCSEAFPGITDRYFALMEELVENPLEVAGDPFGAMELLGVLDDRNKRRSQNPAKLSTYAPLMVSQLEEGDTTILSQILSGQLPPSRTAETLLAQAQAAGLSGDEMTLVNAALTAAKTIDVNTNMARGAITQLESDIADDTANVGLAEYFDDALEAAIKALPDREARIAVGGDYLRLRFAEPDAQGLLGLIAAHFSGEPANRLSTLALAMDMADLVRVYALIGEDNQALEDAVEGEFEAMVYACQEDFVDGFNSEAGLTAENARLPFGPKMQEILKAEIPVFFEACKEVFTPVPRENWLEPVESDLPVLAMNGEIDTQTAYSWGAIATETLSNGQNLVLPESGHGTILFSQCARDITEAFIENPDGKLDTSCIADLRPPVMLPDGTLHPLPL
ncbi:alpha/beta fold hydrolase [Tropicimonas marinistellae]|uniref:alpha/beta fold hydrolase n=1 Tax=Tropicimonas marinistellae TaxID=1739787 RepID=UPI00082B1EA7|nr:alpha/beta fold hydrolase [Tropicimonas marinistellae]